MGRAVGARAGPAGTSSARRWPRSCSASASTSTAAATTSSSPTTRTRRRRRGRRAAPSSPGSGCTTGCSSCGEREDGQVASATSALLAEVLDDVGPRRADPVLRRPATTASRSRFSDEPLERRPQAGVQRIREAGRRLGAGPVAGGPGAAPRRVLRRAAPTTSTRRARWPRSASGSARRTSAERRRRRATCARCSASSGSSNLLDARRRARRPRRGALARAARGGARGAGLRRGRPPARRAARARLGGPRRRRTARSSSRGEAVILYGRNAVREALRAAARPVHDGLGDRGRGARALARGRAVRSSSAEEIEARCGSRRPPGRLRGGRPVPLRRRRPSCSRRPTR